MAISITWATKVINIPQADLTDLGGGIYELDIDVFRSTLNALQASEEGITELTTHVHNAPVTVAGVTLARVVEIINGYTITFENGTYAVNLVGANSNIADVTNVNSVSIRSANTAGLTYSKQIENQSFLNSRIWIDVDTGEVGTVFPLGTPGAPVNNLTNAQSIISSRAMPNRISLRGNLDISGHPLSYYDILGAGRKFSLIDFDGSPTQNMYAKAISATGILSGTVQMELCKLYNLSNFIGTAIGSEISGTITLLNAQEEYYSFIDCHSNATSGSLFPVIDANNCINPRINIKNFAGNLLFKNFSSNIGVANIECLSGLVTIDPTCVSGTITVAGLCQLVDNSGANCNVVSLNVDGSFNGTISGSFSADNEAIATAVWDRTASSNNTSGTMGWLQNKMLITSQSIDKIRGITCGRWIIDGSQMIFFDEDNVTEVIRYNLFDTEGDPFFSEPNAPAERVVVP